MKTFGIILIIIGIITLFWTGFSYTKQEKVVDIGPVEVSAEKEKSFNWPPYAGGILIAGGVLLLFVGKKK
ncbi:hypothetical protein [Olivibacter sitiensis]|uniref:hypothetical protein n=1 Tax=Olivibacter sitiensis TaxID=376470 RepID=UPI0004294DAC|nr:hypothetical protein [Olivibacter sitiensis]